MTQVLFFSLTEPLAIASVPLRVEKQLFANSLIQSGELSAGYVDGPSFNWDLVEWRAFNARDALIEVNRREVGTSQQIYAIS